MSRTHAKPPWGKWSLCRPQGSGVDCPIEFSVVTGRFKYLLCPAPWHLATWRYWALEMWWVWLKKWMLYFIYLWVIVCNTWLGEYFISQCGSRLGASCCPVSPPGTPAPSGHTAGKRLRGLPWWLSGKESTCHSRDMRDKVLIPVSRRSPWEGNGNPLQDSCLENPMHRGAWEVAVHGVTKSQTHNWTTNTFQSNFTYNLPKFFFFNWGNAH